LILRRVYPFVRHRSVGRALALLLLALLGLGIYAVAVEPSRLVVNQKELAVPNWPAALSGKKIALLSDLHIGSPFWDLARLRELVLRVNAERPDLVLLGGDYLINDVIGGKFVAIEPIASELGQLRAPLGRSRGARQSRLVERRPPHACCARGQSDHGARR